MRPGVTLNLGGSYQNQEHLPHQHQFYVSPAPTSAAAVGWRSPVPYLFGGLAAMLGLIAFALLILACSYWKLSGHIDAGENSGEVSGDGKPKGAANATAEKFQDSILVIMAGDERPTYVATPATSKATSFGDSEVDNQSSCSSSSNNSNNNREENRRENVVAMTTMARIGRNDEEEKS